MGRGGRSRSTNRTPRLGPRRGGGSRASGGRQRGCGHYPRGSRWAQPKRDSRPRGASGPHEFFTKRLAGGSAAPTGNPGWRLRHIGRVLRAEAALCLTNEPARLSSGRWPAAPKGGCQRGERPLARFCILLARTKRMASRGGATPPRDAPGGNAEAAARQCEKRSARSWQAKCKTPPPSELLTFSHKRRTLKNETLN